MMRGGFGMPPKTRAPGEDIPQADTAETVYISSLALLKMLRHGRQGVPLEVMGLMLGDFVDEYTVHVVDVFAMPQSGTGVSVEAVDPVFQAEMLEMLAQTGREETVVGWYHSHPGFGPWLSNVDMNTQAAFENLNPRAVAVVVDPIQSVKGKVVIDAFRLIPQEFLMGGNRDPRQTTSNLGHIHQPSMSALIHGLDSHYYSMPIAYRKTPEEESMLLNMDRKDWSVSLRPDSCKAHTGKRHAHVEALLKLSNAYATQIAEQGDKTSEEQHVASAGKKDARRHLDTTAGELSTEAASQTLATAIGTL